MCVCYAYTSIHVSPRSTCVEPTSLRSNPFGCCTSDILPRTPISDFVQLISNSILSKFSILLIMQIGAYLTRITIHNSLCFVQLADICSNGNHICHWAGCTLFYNVLCGYLLQQLIFFLKRWIIEHLPVHVWWPQHMVGTA